MPAFRFHVAILVSVLIVGAVGAQPMPLTGKPGARVDRFGDALPPGALFRIGTSRLQLDRHIQSIVASPDGKLVAAVSDDSLGVWEVPSGREILRRTLTTQDSFLAMSPDGKLLAFNAGYSLVLFDLETGKERSRLGNMAFTGGFARAGSTLTVKQMSIGGKAAVIAEWDAVSGKLLHERPVEPEFNAKAWLQAFGSAISPDGKTLATFNSQGASAKQTIYVHDIASGKLIRQWAVESPTVRLVVFSPDGQFVAGTSTDAIARVWEDATGKERARWKSNGGVSVGAFGFSFAPNGTSILCTQTSGIARWDWQAAKLVQEYPDVGGPIAFAGSGKTMVAQGSLGTIRLVDLETGTDLCPLPRAGKHLAFSADGRLAAWAEGSAIVLAETESGKEVRRWQAHVRYVGPLAFGPDGKTIASAGTDRRIRLWEVASGKQSQSLIKTGVDSLFFSPDSQRLVSSAFGEVCLWNAASGERQGLWAARSGVAMAPDLSSVAVPDEHVGVLRLVDPVSGRRVRELAGYVAQPRSTIDKLVDMHHYRSFQADNFPAFSLDGRRILGGGGGLGGPVFGANAIAICVWNVDTGKKLSPVLSTSEFLPQGLTISPDGSRLAALRRDGKMCLLNLALGEMVRVLGEAEEAVWPTPAFTPDGRLLVTATKRSVQFWEVATGGEIARQPAHRDDVRELIMSANGRCLATTSWDHAILVWDMTRLTAADRPRDAVLAAAGLRAIWADLAGRDAKKGRRAVETLIAAPGQALAFLRERLKPAVSPDAKKLAAMIADLGSDEFERRQQAEQELGDLGEMAAPTLQKTLAANPPLETRRRIEGLLKKLNSADLSAEALRSLRAVQALETIGSQEAQVFLQALADGAAASRQTQDAKTSLERLRKRAATP